MGISNMALMRKAIETSDLASGGYLPEKVVETFLLEMKAKNKLLQLVRTEIMKSHTEKIPKLGVGDKIMRRVGEGQDASTTKGGLAGINTGQIELSTEEFCLPFGFTRKFMEDNIEKGRINEVLGNMFRDQMARDTEYLAVNGDEVSPIPSTTVATTPIDAVTDPVDVEVADISGFPRTSEAGWLVVDSEKMSYESIDIGTNTFINCARAQDGTTIAAHATGQPAVWEGHQLTGARDGWLKLMYAGDSNYVDLSAINSGNIKKDHFFALQRALPEKYHDQGELVWLMNWKQYSLWTEELSDRTTALGDAIVIGQKYSPLGVTTILAPSWPEDVIALTWSKNLIIGIWRQILIEAVVRDFKSVMENSFFFNMSTRIGFGIERDDAVAFGDGLVTL
jgi:hypothetical protein